MTTFLKRLNRQKYLFMSAQIEIIAFNEIGDLIPSPRIDE
jgi:hypothetical protein